MGESYFDDIPKIQPDNTAASNTSEDPFLTLPTKLPPPTMVHFEKQCNSIKPTTTPKQIADIATSTPIQAQKVERKKMIETGAISKTYKQQQMQMETTDNPNTDTDPNNKNNKELNREIMDNTKKSQYPNKDHKNINKEDQRTDETENISNNQHDTKKEKEEVKVPQQNQEELDSKKKKKYKKTKKRQRTTPPTDPDCRRKSSNLTKTNFSPTLPTQPRKLIDSKTAKELGEIDDDKHNYKE